MCMSVFTCLIPSLPNTNIDISAGTAAVDLTTATVMITMATAMITIAMVMTTSATVMTTTEMVTTLMTTGNQRLWPQTGAWLMDTSITKFP